MNAREPLLRLYRIPKTLDEFGLLRPGVPRVPYHRHRLPHTACVEAAPRNAHGHDRRAAMRAGDGKGAGISSEGRSIGLLGNTVGRVAIFACRIGDMIMARRRGSGLDEVTRVPGRRPMLFSDARETLRPRLEELQSTFLIQTTQAAGRSTDRPLDDAPIAAFAGAFLGCLATECFSVAGTIPCIASAWATAILCGLLLITRTASLFTGAFFPALYGGTFAGMTPIFWLSDSATGALAVALSIVCGLVFFVVAELDSRSAAPIGIGCGGRLGAIAVVASFLFVELVRPLDRKSVV